MTYAFALLAAGTVAILAGIKNRPLASILRGVTDPAPGGPGETGFHSSIASEPQLVSSRSGRGAGGTAAPAVLSPGLVTPSAPWNPSHKPMCAWIAAELAAAYKAGGRFTVTSGYRSTAEQARACAETSGPCATPGQSNHQGKAYPKGAVDIEGAASLAAHLPPGGRLHWTGKSIGDDVHFSSGKNGV